MRFLLYSHDGLGLGHTRRNIAIAAAITKMAPDASVLLITGSDDVYALGVPSTVEVLKIPGLRKVANGHYGARRLALDDKEIIGLRSGLIETTVKSYCPDVMLVDKHPFGAGGELRPAHGQLASQGGRAVLGLRDILDDRATVLKEWKGSDLQRRVAAAYDEVFIYGNSNVFDPIVEYDFPETLAVRTRFCGYVVNEMEPVAIPQIWHRSDRPTVLASTGGGEDGFKLLETFILAAKDAPWRSIVVTGPMAGQHEQAALRQQALHADVEFHIFLPDMPRVISAVDAIVCMGGYNTLAEAAADGVPIICVPRTRPRSEQKIRAEAFERLGLLRTILPERLGPGALREGIEEVLDWRRPELRERALQHLDFNGAERSAGHLIRLAETRSQRVAV